MEFKDCIKSKIREALDASKKQGHQRDIDLLTDVLSILFFQRDSINRTIDDIIPALGPKYAGLKKDTLEDNLEYLSKTPEAEPFLKISRESQEIPVYSALRARISDQTSFKLPSKEGRPKNIYTLNDYYIYDCFGRTSAVRLTADILLK